MFKNKKSFENKYLKNVPYILFTSQYCPNPEQKGMMLPPLCFSEKSEEIPKKSIPHKFVKQRNK